MLKDKQNLDQVPLGFSDFAHIEQLLLRVGEKPYKDLVYLDGFLMALESAPHKINVDQWFSPLLSPDIHYQTHKEALELLLLLNRFSHQIACDLQKLEARSHRIEPLIFENGVTVHFLDASYDQIARWCDGYIDGAILDGGEWSKSKAGRAVLMPISIMAGYFTLSVSLSKPAEAPSSPRKLDLGALYQIRHASGLPQYILNNYQFCRSLKIGKQQKDDCLH